MAVTYGFFNSVNGDRKYNADQMSEYFRGIVSQGVFQHLDSGMAVSAGTGLSVSVAAGRAIIQNRWVQNSAALNLTISDASETYGRKDAVVIRLDKSSRAISITVKTGTPAASPVAPEMTRNATTYEMALAYVNVAAGASSVTVTDKRSDSSVCGWAAVAQATSGEVDQMLNDMKTGFDGVTYSSPAEMVQSCDELLRDSFILGNTNLIYEEDDKTTSGFDSLDVIQTNLLNKDGALLNTSINDGTVYYNDIKSETGYVLYPTIKVKPNTTYFFGYNIQDKAIGHYSVKRLYIFDSNGYAINYKSNVNHYTTENNEYYLRLCIQSSDIYDLVVTEDLSFGYSPYGYIKETKNRTNNLYDYSKVLSNYKYSTNDFVSASGNYCTNYIPVDEGTYTMQYFNEGHLSDWTVNFYVFDSSFTRLRTSHAATVQIAQGEKYVVIVMSSLAQYAQFKNTNTTFFEFYSEPESEYNVQIVDGYVDVGKIAYDIEQGVRTFNFPKDAVIRMYYSIPCLVDGLTYNGNNCVLIQTRNVESFYNNVSSVIVRDLEIKYFNIFSEAMTDKYHIDLSSMYRANIHHNKIFCWDYDEYGFDADIDSDFGEITQTGGIRLRSASVRGAFVNYVCNNLLASCSLQISTSDSFCCNNVIWGWCRPFSARISSTSNVLFFGNQTVGSKESGGLVLYNTSEIKVIGNEFDGNTQGIDSGYGIYATGASRTIIKDNDFYLQSNGGITMENCEMSIISGNTFSENNKMNEGGSDIYISNTDGTKRVNTIIGNTLEYSRNYSFNGIEESADDSSESVNIIKNNVIKGGYTEDIVSVTGSIVSDNISY